MLMVRQVHVGGGSLLVTNLRRTHAYVLFMSNVMMDT